jgi:hypothetical protein
MSNEANDHKSISAHIKKLIALVAAIMFTMTAWFAISTAILNDWPDHTTIGYAFFFVGACAFMYCIGGATERPTLQRAMRKASLIAGIIAMILASGAVIEFAFQGAPAMTSPMQNEWRAHFAAIGIITFCAATVMPSALNWMKMNLFDRT